MWHLKEDAEYFLYSHMGIKDILRLIACPILWPFRWCHRPRCTPEFQLDRQRSTKHLSRISQRRREREIRTRKRDLSTDRNHKRRMNKQDQSPLLAKLPAELRLRIYEMVLCETGRVHVRATGEHSDQMRLQSTTCVIPGRLNTGHEMCHVGEPILNVLLTCRRIYCEAIDLLYSGNDFIFPSQKDFEIFTRSVLPQRLDRIKKLSFDYNISFDDRLRELDRVEWQCFGKHEYEHGMFTAISSMRNLQSVYLTFDMQGDRTWGEEFHMSFAAVDVAVSFESPICPIYLFINVYEPLTSGLRKNDAVRYDAVSGKPMLYGLWTLGELIRLR